VDVLLTSFTPNSVPIFSNASRWFSIFRQNDRGRDFILTPALGALAAAGREARLRDQLHVILQEYRREDLPRGTGSPPPRLAMLQLPSKKRSKAGWMGEEAAR